MNSHWTSAKILNTWELLIWVLGLFDKIRNMKPWMLGAINRKSDMTMNRILDGKNSMKIDLIFIGLLQFGDVCWTLSKGCSLYKLTIIYIVWNEFFSYVNYFSISCTLSHGTTVILFLFIRSIPFWIFSRTLSLLFDRQ